MSLYALESPLKTSRLHDAYDCILHWLSLSHFNFVFIYFYCNWHFPDRIWHYHVSSYLGCLVEFVFIGRRGNCIALFLISFERLLYEFLNFTSVSLIFLLYSLSPPPPSSRSIVSGTPLKLCNLHWVFALLKPSSSCPSAQLCRSGTRAFPLIWIQIGGSPLWRKFVLSFCTHS